MKRRLLMIPAVLLASLLILQGCTPSGDTTTQVATETAAATVEPAASVAENTELVLTLDELAQYNGKNGNPAYIAVDGVIYDVTNIPQWSSGEHNGFSAGNDLTVEIKTISPHGVSKLNLVKAVGKLAD